MQKRARVFVVEDHDVIRATLVDSLAQLGPFDVIGHAGRAQGAVEEIARLAPHIALIDMHLPDGNGIELCRSLRHVAPAVRSVILTSREYPHAIDEARAAGALAFLLKTARLSALGADLQRVLAGESLFATPATVIDTA